MGFFKKLFKRKKGGTVFGNLLRGVSSGATGGLLGSGKGLAKWQANKEKREFETVYAEQQKRLQQDQAYQQGQQLSAPLGEQFNRHVNNSPTAQNFQNQQATAWAKRNWMKIAAPLAALLGGVYVLSKKK